MGTVQPIDGSPSETVYLVRYDEEQWLKYDEAGQQFCFDTWIKKATPLGCKFVTLILEPDPLFPTNGKEKPYVFKSVPVPGNTVKPSFSFDVLVCVNISSERAYTEELVRDALFQLRRKYSGIGAGYEIYHGNKLMAAGKV